MTPPAIHLTSQVQLWRNCSQIVPFFEDGPLTVLPDLSSLDYFLWGYLKSVVHHNKPTTLVKLKRNIVKSMGAILRAVWRGVMNNFCATLEKCLQREERHFLMNNIILLNRKHLFVFQSLNVDTIDLNLNLVTRLQRLLIIYYNKNKVI